MARKDDIFKSFINHELIETKYGVNRDSLPCTLQEGLNSNVPIIKAIAIIVDGLEKKPSATDNELRNTVTQFLNTAI